MRELAAHAACLAAILACAAAHAPRAHRYAQGAPLGTTAQPPAGEPVVPGTPATPAAPPAAPPPVFGPIALARPVEVRARLLTGGTFAGRMDRWDSTALHGAFGTRAWAHLVAADMRRIYMQAMDRTRGEQWLVLGELLAASPDGRAHAADAFKHARLNGQSDEQIAAARARAELVVAERAKRDADDAAKRLRQGRTTPGHAASDPWPALTPAERTDAVVACRATLRSAMELASVRGDVVESRFFVLGGDLSKPELEQLGRDMDAACIWGMTILGTPPDPSPFWGKPVVLAVAAKDTFVVAEAAVHGAAVAEGQRVAMHTDGPKVALTACRANDASGLRTAVLQGVGRALLYRSHSAVPLPAWAEQGFADWVARGADRAAPIDRERRATGLHFLRHGGQAAAVLASTPDAGTWPGPHGVGPAVGYLTIDYMIGEQPALFGQWVAMVKGGTPWEQAMQKVYGVAPARMGALVNAWYRTNDGPPRR